MEFHISIRKMCSKIEQRKNVDSWQISAKCWKFDFNDSRSRKKTKKKGIKLNPLLFYKRTLLLWIDKWYFQCSHSFAAEIRFHSKKSKINRCRSDLISVCVYVCVFFNLLHFVSFLFLMFGFYPASNSIGSTMRLYTMCLSWFLIVFRKQKSNQFVRMA